MCGQLCGKQAPKDVEIIENMHVTGNAHAKMTHTWYPDSKLIYALDCTSVAHWTLALSRTHTSSFA